MRRAWLVVGVLVAVLAACRGSSSGDDEAAPSTSTSTTTTSTSTEVEGTAGAPGIGDPYFPTLGNGGYDVAHYDLELTWLGDAGRIEGITTIDAKATQDLSRFDLDLSGLEVSAVVVDGRAATFHRQDRELQITPARALAQGDPFTVKVTYGGSPKPVHEGTDLFATGWQTDGREAFVASEPSGAETWFPSNDHPADKATYTIHITAPADQVVAANGVLKAKDDIGHGTLAWTYDETYPMASYLVQVAIGDYQLVDDGSAGGVHVRHVFHRSLVANATAAASRTKDHLTLLASMFGPFPFAEYGVLAVPEELGFALETQTLTLIGSDVAAQRQGAAETLLHEMAHQWYGDAVSPATWKDIWLNEGFATYAEWLAEERTGGSSAHDKARVVLATADVDLTRPPGDPGPDELFSATVYYRGAMTLQALREEVGDDAFFTILRRWYADHRGGDGSTPELMELAEDASGKQLDALFQTWLYTPAKPSF